MDNVDHLLQTIPEGVIRKEIGGGGGKGIQTLIDWLKLLIVIWILQLSYHFDNDRIAHVGYIWVQTVGFNFLVKLAYLVLFSLYCLL